MTERISLQPITSSPAIPSKLQFRSSHSYHLARVDFCFPFSVIVCTVWFSPLAQM